VCVFLDNSKWRRVRAHLAMPDYCTLIKKHRLKKIPNWSRKNCGGGGKGERKTKEKVPVWDFSISWLRTLVVTHLSMTITSNLQKTWGNLQQADGPLKGKAWPACYIQVYLWSLKTFFQKPFVELIIKIRFNLCPRAKARNRAHICMHAHSSKMQ